MGRACGFSIIQWDNDNDFIFADDLNTWRAYIEEFEILQDCRMREDTGLPKQNASLQEEEEGEEEEKEGGRPLQKTKRHIKQNTSSHQERKTERPSLQTASILKNGPLYTVDSP